MQRFILAILLLTTTRVSAETVYIRDTVYVPLRGGQSNEHRILHSGVRSGTKMELLEENSDTGFSLVRMESGLEGWMPTQYLVDQPIAKDLLEQTNDSLNSLLSKHEKALQHIRDIENTLEQTDQTGASLRAENSKLHEEIDRITRLSANVIAIDQENSQLRSEQDLLKAMNDSLEEANRKLKDESNRDWFLNGAGVVLVGLLFGFWVARSIYQKRDTAGWS